MQIVPQNFAAVRFGPADFVRGARDRSELPISASSPASASNGRASNSRPTKDTLEISLAAEMQLAAEEKQTSAQKNQNTATTDVPADSAASEDATRSQSGKTEASPTGELPEEQQKVVDELKSTDREVRTHEQAHLAAAGGFAKGGPTYSYQRGPDGQQYAVGGEVAIDTSPIPGDPEATIVKARVVRAAANAPAEPSSQDRAVAVAAIKLEIQATKRASSTRDRSPGGRALQATIASWKKFDHRERAGRSERSDYRRTAARLDWLGERQMRIYQSKGISLQERSSRQMGTGSECECVKTRRKVSFAQCLYPFVDGQFEGPLKRGTGTVTQHFRIFTSLKARSQSPFSATYILQAGKFSSAERLSSSAYYSSSLY